MLRALLGRWLERDPAGLRFVLGEHGKPALASGELEFSVSHSGDLVAIAVAEGRAVGIDVERVRDVEEERVADRLFAPAEAEALRSLPAAERTSEFFRLWTRKEAYVKALGTGIATGLSEVGEGWTVVDLPVPPGYAGALAAAGEGRRLRWTDV